MRWFSPPPCRANPPMWPRKISPGRSSPGRSCAGLGTLFVERHAIIESLADTEIVVGAARQGRILVFFPEGTFTRRAGLSEFYLGAFKVAAEAGLPVLPGILRGTRSMLRGEQWFPRWAPLGVDDRGRDRAVRNRLRVAGALARCGAPGGAGALRRARPRGAGEAVAIRGGWRVTVISP